MSSSVRDIIAGVYERLRDPDTVSLSIGYAHSMLAGALQYYLNKLNLSDSNWILGHVDITVTPGVDSYTVEPDDFGRAVLVETTNAGSNDLYMRRYLDIVDKQDLRPMRIEPLINTGLTTPFYKHNSFRTSFYRDSSTGLMTMQFDPSPMNIAVYRVYYEPNGLDKPALADNIVFLNNFSELLKVATAVKCLPAIVENVSPMLFKALDEGLKMELARLEAQFDSYISNNHQEFAGPIQPYNNSLWF